MEGDTIRTSGTSTLVDLWVEGAMREIVITGEAIAAAAGAERSAAMDEQQRCEFVRARLGLVQMAARTAIEEAGGHVSRVTLKAACLVDPSLGSGGERRRSERRGNERRKPAGAAASPKSGERRRSDRRRGDRRGTHPANAPV